MVPSTGPYDVGGGVATRTLVKMCMNEQFSSEKSRPGRPETSLPAGLGLGNGVPVGVTHMGGERGGLPAAPLSLPSPHVLYPYWDPVTKPEGRSPPTQQG